MADTLAKLYETIDAIEIAMMTTRRADGHLRSRAMATQKPAAGADLWFVTYEGDPRHGTPDDPRMVLIGVQVHAAEFLDVTKPRPVLLFEFVKGWLTGADPKFGEMHELDAPHRPRT